MTNGEAINWLRNLRADIGKIEHHELWHYEQALEEIQELLAGTEIIRCKDCKHYDRHDHRCKVWNHGINVEDFCSRGERKEE